MSSYQFKEPEVFLLGFITQYIHIRIIICFPI
jgi:hypothetical protein